MTTERGAAALTERPVAGAPVPLFEIPGWDAGMGVVAGVTGRRGPDGPFDLKLESLPPRGPTLDRWSALLAAFPGFGGLVASRQVHEKAVRWHDRVEGLTVLSGFDGHATRTPGLLMAISLADCIPIYLLDPRRRAAALLHAGWRGTAAGILDEGVGLLAGQAGSVPKDLIVHFGVGICGRCYEVGPEVLAACGRPVPDSGKGRCDLREVLVEQAGGIGIGKISTSTRCSAHQNDLFFSHRASLGKDGRMVAYLGLVP